MNSVNGRPFKPCPVCGEHMTVMDEAVNAKRCYPCRIVNRRNIFQRYYGLAIDSVTVDNHMLIFRMENGKTISVKSSGSNISADDQTVAESVKTIIDNQQDKGREKYGMSVDDAPLLTVEWVRHAQEEAADMLVYLEKIRRNLLAQPLDTIHDGKPKNGDKE